MRLWKSLPGYCLVAAMFSVTVIVAQPRREPAEMEPMLGRIATYQYGESRVVQAEFIQYIQDCLWSPAMVKQIEARLLGFIQSPDTTGPARVFALRELGLIASDASLPVLSPMLTRPETAEAARYALARLPGAAADQSLLTALGQTNGRIQIGIIDSLSQRRTAKAVPALATLLTPADPPVSGAAAAALAHIADRPALNALRAARSKLSGPLRQKISEAYLECANEFSTRGDRATAAKAYRELIAPEEPEALRAHALTRLAIADPKGAVSALAAEIESNDRKGRMAAIRALGGISGPEVTSTLVGEYPKLPPASQVVLIGTLAERGDSAARPLLLAAVKSDHPDVRAAGLSGLGKLGDPSSLMALAEAAAESSGSVQAAARESLDSLKGPGVDAALVAAIGSSSGKVKAELVMAAGMRGATGAVDAVVKTIQDTDSDVHREALRALKNVAGPAQVPVLLDVVLNAATAADRKDATQTLATVLERSKPSPIAPVLTAYRSTSALEARVSLLEVMGQTSNAEALPALRASLQDSSPEVARAGVLALTQWTNPAPLNDLLLVARGGTNLALQVLGLRGYLALMATPSQRTDVESARLLGQVMPLAKQAAEKRMVLSRLAGYPCKESLDLAQASLNDPEVASEARAAVDRINRFMSRHPQ